MTKRRLRLYDPRQRSKSITGIRVSHSTLLWLEALRAWILEEMWSNKGLRPEDWNGKLTHEECLRFVLRHFHEAYGAPAAPVERKEECDPAS